MSLQIEQVSNGYIVEHQEDQKVFTNFDAMMQHLKQKLVKPDVRVIDNVIPIELRAPWAFKEGMD